MKSQELRTLLEEFGFKPTPYLTKSMQRFTGPFHEEVAIHDEEPQDAYVVYYAMMHGEKGHRVVASGSDLLENLYIVLYPDENNQVSDKRKSLVIFDARIHNNFE